MLRLRLSLLPLLFAGCASGLMTVPDADWNTVPPAQRAALDRQYETDIAAARAELADARTSLAQLRAAPPPAAEARPPAVAASDQEDPAWAAAVVRYDQDTTAARTRVDTAKLAAQRADLTWRQARVAAAESRLDVVARERELKRAKAIDHNLLGTDTYDGAPLRGQLSQAQKRWYADSTAEHHARGELDHAAAAVSTAKEAYAQLMRGGPGHTPVEAPAAMAEAELPKPHFELTGWAITRSDVTRRHGLRHYLEQAMAQPAQLRRTSVRLGTDRLPVARPAQPSAAVDGHGDAAASLAPARPAAARPEATAKPGPAKPVTAATDAKPAPAKPADAAGTRPAPTRPVDPAAAAVAARVKPAAAVHAQPAAASAKPVEP
jgi:hypothetical protein